MYSGKTEQSLYLDHREMTCKHSMHSWNSGTGSYTRFSQILDKNLILEELKFTYRVTIAALTLATFSYVNFIQNFHIQKKSHEKYQTRRLVKQNLVWDAIYLRRWPEKSFQENFDHEQISWQINKFKKLKSSSHISAGWKCNSFDTSVILVVKKNPVEKLAGKGAPANRSLLFEKQLKTSTFCIDNIG